MGKKLLLLTILLLSCVGGGYGLVFGGNLVFNPEIQFVGTISGKVYLDDEKLSSTTVVYQSNTDISSYDVTSSCNIDSQFLESYKSLYFFEVSYSESPNCRNGNIILELGEDKIVSSMTKLELSYFEQELGVFMDYSTDDLNMFSESLERDLTRYGVYKNYNSDQVAKYYKYLKGQRRYLEAEYVDTIISQIVAARELKYISPIPGRTVSEKHSKVPNSGRPYRAAYTDGIHRGWDIDGDLGEEVVALDDGIVVRIVDDFDNSDFSRIVYGDNLSEEQELKNLDVLRGNQVWLKTMKGEVVFYSHLDDVSTTISEGMFVNRGHSFGTTGISGVPGEDYDDYHLHFAIMQNPYVFENAGTYDLGDYMAWDWLTRGMSHAEVIEEQKNIFE